MKNIHFLLSWYLTTVFTLVFSLLLLTNITFPRILQSPSQSHYQLYKALPATAASDNIQDTTIAKTDGRELIVASFFNARKSPLADFADTFIEVADRYQLDYRLLPAIAMQESQGGKRIPKGSYNPFGYGIYGKKVLQFASFEEAIEKVAQGLKKNYLEQGLETPEQIMIKYTPPSLTKGGSWAIGVSAFMEQLR